LGVWGAGEGPYLMLPLLGPSNPRDGVGLAVDQFLNPIEWYLAGVPFSGDGGVANSVPPALLVTDGLDQRSRNIEALDALEANSLDFYATVRSLYRQRRDSAIANGEVVGFGDAVEEAPRP
ncbi:MAG: MlaA family lipoprotein, partial [Pseudomonadota bacterium]